jgi:hypothetical protein
MQREPKNLGLRSVPDRGRNDGRYPGRGRKETGRLITVNVGIDKVAMQACDHVAYFLACKVVNIPA